MRGKRSRAGADGSKRQAGLTNKMDAGGREIEEDEAVGQSSTGRCFVEEWNFWRQR